MITGDENETDLFSLSKDVFDYFGLGCRNITKLYLPKDYSIEKLIAVLDNYEALEEHHKYRNNYDYNYALYLLNQDVFLAGQNVLLKEDVSYISRIACLHYEYYNTLNEIRDRIEMDQDLIQCISTATGKILSSVKEVRFGETQKPGLKDYADGIDVMKFLSEL